jgi:hypothetical protein
MSSAADRFRPTIGNNLAKLVKSNGATITLEADTIFLVAKAQIGALSEGEVMVSGKGSPRCFHRAM